VRGRWEYCIVFGLFKGTSGQIGSAQEWYHRIGLEKDINRYWFFIFYFWSWLFDMSSKFWAASCKNESNLLLVWITVCLCYNHDLFCQKCRRDINCSLDYGLWERNSNIPPSELKYFSSNKSAPAKRKTGLYPIHCWWRSNALTWYNKCIYCT